MLQWNRTLKCQHPIRRQKFFSFSLCCSFLPSIVDVAAVVAVVNDIVVVNLRSSSNDDCIQIQWNEKFESRSFLIFYSPKNLSKKSFFFSRNNEDISEELDACLGSIAVQRNNVFIFVLENLWTHTHSLKERERERKRKNVWVLCVVNMVLFFFRAKSHCVVVVVCDESSQRGSRNKLIPASLTAHESQYARKIASIDIDLVLYFSLNLLPRVPGSTRSSQV